MTEQTNEIEAKVVEVEPAAQIVPVQAAPNLFRTDDPGEVLKRAQSTAEALMPVVRDKGLVAQIQGREHLMVEAWQTLGAMLGVTGVCVWTRQLDNGWEARVEARTLDGRVIGAAEAECLRAERQWANRDDFALRSMAQTRATSKALASVLRFVATLGGASGTPAEEMPRDGGAAPAGGSETPATTAQKNRVKRELDKLPEEHRETLFKHFGAETKSGASNLIDALAKRDHAEVMREAGIEAKSDVPWDDEA